MAKERGIGLTIWLLFMLVANFFVALTYLLLNKAMMSVYPDVAGWVWYLYGALGLANVVFVIFLFKWKKWPFFAFCGMSVIAFIMNLMIGLGIATALFGLIGPIVLYFFMRSRWDLFE